MIKNMIYKLAYILIIVLLFVFISSCEQKETEKKSENSNEETASDNNSDNNETSDNQTNTDNSTSKVCPKYDRDDYKHWIDEDGDCQDTRVEVLIAENQGTISFSTSSSCKVVSGSWFDPFTNTTFTEASSLDVDHMVPLKEAHESGAFEWSSEKKQKYAKIFLLRILLLQYPVVPTEVKDQETLLNGFQPTVVIKIPMPVIGQASKSNGA